jgi:hypothetical protein
MRPSLRSNHFILQVFDCELWCPIAQSLFHAADIEALRTILGLDADQDSDIGHSYHPDEDQLAKLVVQFGINFDRSEFTSGDLMIELFRWHPLSAAPYLIHTGYELPLLLDGRKKLARMTHAYPPMTFAGEHRFDHCVAQGLLHREVVIEPFEASAKGYGGTRTVFYTPKGQEWRIPAHNLIWQAVTKGWNENFERLEGMLFGYEEWQNDWWLDHVSQRGAFGGIVFCCPVTLVGLAWMEAAGFRALPPIDHPALMIASYDPDANADLCARLLESPGSAAVVRFNVPGREAMDFIDLKTPGPWQVRAERIGQLNRHLKGPIVVVGRRSGPV